LRQQDEIYREIKIANVKFDSAVLPHPSGRNMFWNNPQKEGLNALRNLMEFIKGDIAVALPPRDPFIAKESLAGGNSGLSQAKY